MQAIVMAALAALGKLGLEVVTSMVTANLLKHGVIIALEKIAKKTDTDVDDRLLSTLRKDWGMEDEVSKNESTKSTD